MAASQGKRRPTGGVGQLRLSLDGTSRYDRLRYLGIREFGDSPHTSRTMMLAELSVLLDEVGCDATRADYGAAIIDANVLGKTSTMNRKKTDELLVRVYGLDGNLPLFRALRRFWRDDDSGRPVLALLAAMARDPVLRSSWPLVQAQPVGAVVTSAQFADGLRPMVPHYSPKSLASLGRNVASTWGQAGHLQGIARRRRQRPQVSVAAVAFALLLGHLEGHRGLALFDTTWTSVLELPSADLLSFAAAASQRGLLQLLRVGDVVEVRFPNLLTEQEEALCHEPA
jgi:hypothetical protein